MTCLCAPPSFTPCMRVRVLQPRHTYTVNATVDAVQRAVTNFYALNEMSPDTYFYTYQDPEGTIPVPATLSVTAYTDLSALFDPTRTFTGTTATTTYNLNATHFGPLSYSQGYTALQNFFHSLVSMDLYLPPLQNFAFGTLYRNCFVWGIVVHYNFINRGQIEYVRDWCACACACVCFGVTGHEPPL